MKLRKVIASVLSVMTVCGMFPTTAFAYEINDAEQNPTENYVSSTADTPLKVKTKDRSVQPSAASNKTPEPSGASSHSEETTALVDSGNYGANDDDVRWEFYESGTLYIYGTGNMYDIFISAGVPYVKYRHEIKKAVIESGVMHIGTFAFWRCDNLTSVTLPSGLTSIGENAFDECSSLTSIEIPNTVTMIKNNAFESCTNLTNIDIPDSVTSIGDFVFEACSNLKSINVDSNNQNYVSDNGVLFNKNKTKLIAYPPRKIETSYTIPNSVTSIKAYAFYGCKNLTSITIPNGVTNIGKYAFSYCSSLTNIQIPSKVTSIGDYVFASCSNLKYIGVDSSNPSYLSENGVLLDKNKTTLIAYPAGNTKTSYKMSNGITSLKPGAFQGCINLTSITLLDSITSIPESAFQGCSSLTSLNIPNNVTNIGNSAFKGCASLTNITIPDGVKDMGGSTFEGCSSLTSVTLPSNLGSIRVFAFENCSNLKYVYYTGSETQWNNLNIGMSGNSYLLSAKHYYNVSVAGECGEIGDNVQWILYNDGRLVIHGSGNMKDYLRYNDEYSNNRMPYDSYSSKITNVVIESGVTSIGDCAFNGCQNLSDFTISNSVTRIGNSALESCYKLKNINVDSGNQYFLSDNGVLFNKDKTILITYSPGKSETSYIIPNSVKNIGNSAFFYCPNLTSITIPNSVTSIGDYAFYSCTKLKSLTIPDSVTSIGSNAFWNCYRLTNIELPNSLTSIGEGMFYACDSLTNIDIPNNVTSIGTSAFYCCHGLTSVTIPNNVTSIGNTAFFGCSNLTDIIIPDTVTNIGSSAFMICNNLKNVYYTGTQTQWKQIRIQGGNGTLTSASIHYNYRDKYNITYDMNGGNGLIENQVKTYGQDLTLSSTVPTRTGYIFIGWNTDNTATVPEYQAGDNYTANADATLYAVWVSKLVNSSTASNLNTSVGSSVTINGSATGGTGNYTYEFYYKKQGASSWSKFGSSYQTANTATLKTSSAGTFIVRTYAKDGKSSVVKDFTITFTAPLTNKTTVTTTTPKVGTVVKINGSATGGTGTYTYEFYYKRQGASSWSTFGANYKTDTTATLRASSAGSFDVRVYVKDSSGKTSVKNFVITYSK